MHVNRVAKQANITGRCLLTKKETQIAKNRRCVSANVSLRLARVAEPDRAAKHVWQRCCQLAAAGERAATAARRCRETENRLIRAAVRDGVCVRLAAAEWIMTVR